MLQKDASAWNNDPIENNNHEYFNDSNSMEMDAPFKIILFDDVSIRRNFIHKVYLILMAQLLLTFAIVASFVFNETLQAFVQHNPSIFWLAFIVLLVTMLIMVCFDDVRRQTPLNYIFLFLFTLALSFMLCIVICLFAVNEILLAIGITAVICLTLSLYAMQSKYDFTVMGGVLLVAIVILFIFAVFTLFFPVRLMVLLYSIMGAVLFSIYLIYDTQLMMGGQHKYALNPEEYIFAALNLYLDIINIFLYILSFISFSRS